MRLSRDLPRCRRGIHVLSSTALVRQIPKLRARADDSLTTRERQIVLVLAEGLTNKEIARRLRLTEGTVKVHLHNIYQKLGISNRTALAILTHTKTPAA